MPIGRKRPAADGAVELDSGLPPWPLPWHAVTTTPPADSDFWSGKKVLVTGHSGFKGTWLGLWLERLGAEVAGLSLEPNTEPSMFELVDGVSSFDTTFGSINDPATVQAVMDRIEPDVVFHLAAQVLVRQSYVDPIETFTTNVVGTANVLNGARSVDGLQAVVVVTSDKCYENKEWLWPYRESEPMGGHDPYSASKGCTELVTASMRRSFFHEPGSALIGSGRAGNVIGGGDWSADRLIPDIVRAFVAGEEVVIRMPEAIRPWQHVLEPLAGYLTLAERLAGGDAEAAEGWNFGPADTDARPVGWIVDRMTERWGGDASFRIERGGPHEATYLKLDCSKASARFGWRPRLDLDTAIDWVIDWYRAQVAGENMRTITLSQIAAYEAREPLRP